MRSVKTLLNHDVRKQKQIERIEKHIHLTIVLAIPFFLRRFAHPKKIFAQKQL